MKILRIEVEEGWLDGLGLNFHDGLNVIIGPRGTGKTSIIELIRFCLGVPAYTDEISQKSRNHALTILGSGQVSLTVSHNGDEFFLTRTLDEANLPPTIPFPQPILLSQNEIEKVALEDRSKLRLIDTFMTDPIGTMLEEQSILSKIESYTIQMQSIADDVSNLTDRISTLSSIDDELSAAEHEQQEQTRNLSEMELQQKELNKLADKTAALGVKADFLERVIDTFKSFREQLSSVIQFPPSLETWPESAGPNDEITDIRQILDRSIDSLRTVHNDINESLNKLNASVNETKENRVELEKQARGLRQQIDGIQKGAGALARRVAELRERKGQREALISLRQERLGDIDKIKEQRTLSLDNVEGIREKKFRQRNEAAVRLNSELSPLIEVSIIQSGIFDDYEAAISETLRGSGVHYNILSPILAEKMSPRELGEAIETGNIEGISESAEIPEDRANRLALAAQATGVHRILSCKVEDGAIFKLLVGVDYKPTERLSTGQRCTVILPILLSDHGRTLIIDQPEDNLDNAFIVDTVVKAIRLASSKNQIICSTHNPNIPVLGEANQVVLLGSDGARGFVRQAKPLDDPLTIDAITSVMEGGLEAFMRRAEFYRREHL